MKIASAVVGLSLAVGMGVAIGARENAKAAQATGDAEATVTIADYATEHSWSTSTAYSSVTIDSHVTAEAIGGGSTGKYYTDSPAGWRFYESASSVLRISVGVGYELDSVTLTHSQSNKGIAVYDGNNMTSGVAQAVSGRSAEFTVTHSEGDKTATIGIRIIKVNYHATFTTPMDSNPILSTGGSASVSSGDAIPLSVTVSEGSDEPVIVTIAEGGDSYISVTGSGYSYAINGLTVTESPVRVTVAGAAGIYSSYVDVSVTAVVQTIKDKIFDMDTFGLNGTYSSSSKAVEAVTYSWVYARKYSSAFNLKAGEGYLINETGYEVNESAKYIKNVTIFCKSTNTGTFKVYKSTDKETYTEISATGGYVASGVNVFSFGDSNNQYFKIAGGSGNTCYCDNIVIELKDNSSSELSGARGAAATILESLSGLCGADGTGNVSSSQWDALNSEISGISAGAKLLLKQTPTFYIDDLSFTGSTIENAMYHYNYCVTKFGYSPIASITDSTPASRAVGNEHIADATIIPIIIICSSVCLVSFGIYMILKKNKAQ